MYAPKPPLVADAKLVRSLAHDFMADLVEEQAAAAASEARAEADLSNQLAQRLLLNSVARVAAGGRVDAPVKPEVLPAPVGPAPMGRAPMDTLHSPASTRPPSTAPAYAALLHGTYLVWPLGGAWTGRAHVP